MLTPLTQDLVTATLLRTYLGRDAGDRVFRGQVKRGDGQELRAVIWFSDLRGFTRLSATLDRAVLLDLLNACFELAVTTIEAHGGQVLKFMGDGLLGVFPVGDDPTPACHAARAAADAFQEGLGALRIQREAKGLPAPEVGVGLHLGEVTYGNIGAPGRLDFTVIGADVNLAARIEGLCGQLGEPVLSSDAVARHDVTAWEPVGTHRVKGVEAAVRVSRPSSA